MGGVLYLHGFCSSSKSTKGQFLSARFAEIGVDVTSPDLDEGDFRNTTLTKQLALVGQLAKELQPAMLIGSSLGGYLAALHAAREPTTVPALVLMAPAFDFANRFNTLLGEEIDRWQKEGSLPLYHYRYQREVRLRYAFIQDAMGFEAFPDVRMPTKVLHGLGDKVVSPRLAEQFAHDRPNVELEWFETDHSMLDATDRIWPSVRRFYARSVPAHGLA